MDAEEWGEEGAFQMVSGGVSLPWRIPGILSGTRFKVQRSLLFVTYTIIQGIISSEM